MSQSAGRMAVNTIDCIWTWKMQQIWRVQEKLVFTSLTFLQYFKIIFRKNITECMIKQGLLDLCAQQNLGASRMLLDCRFFHCTAGAMCTPRDARDEQLQTFFSNWRKVKNCLQLDGWIGNSSQNGDLMLEIDTAADLLKLSSREWIKLASIQRVTTQNIKPTACGDSLRKYLPQIGLLQTNTLIEFEDRFVSDFKNTFVCMLLEKEVVGLPSL